MTESQSAEEPIVDGHVMIKGSRRAATKYAGEGGGVWFLVDPEAWQKTWRKAGATTARTFKAS